MRDTVAKDSGPGRAALPGVAAAAVGVVALVAIAAVWWLQARGYAPCELCLKERIPYYAAIVLAGALALAGPSASFPALRRRTGSRARSARLPGPVLRAGYALLVVVWVISAALGVYHAGVEWKYWPGPTECSGAAAAPAAVGDFLKQLRSVTVVRCDEAALEVLGLSLAAWNAILSACLAVVSALGWRRASAP